jgi:hypothetical protein
MNLPPDDSDLRLPDRLQRDLRAALGRAVRMPGGVPARLEEALRTATQRPPLRSRPWWLAGTAAAAAAAGLLLWLYLTASPPAAMTPPIARAEFDRADFDRDGRVLVLDAYRLALALRRGETVPGSCDLDGDGRVDARDVDQIAAAAVRLGG